LCCSWGWQLAALVEIPDLEERRAYWIDEIRKEDQEADADCALRRSQRPSALRCEDLDLERATPPADRAGGPTPRPATASPLNSTPQPLLPTDTDSAQDVTAALESRLRAVHSSASFASSTHSPALSSTPAHALAPAPSLPRPFSDSPAQAASSNEALSVSNSDTTLTSGNRTIVDSAFEEHSEPPQRLPFFLGSDILGSSGPCSGRSGHGLAGSVGTLLEPTARRGAASDSASVISEATATDQSTGEGTFHLDEDYFA
jgi:hypothetical protein